MRPEFLTANENHWHGYMIYLATLDEKNVDTY